MIKVGTKVAYSVQFLRSIGVRGGDMAHARGTVTKLQKVGGSLTLAHVDWDCDMPDKVNVKNLAKKGCNTKFSAC